MGWLRLVGSFKLQVSFAKEPYIRDEILQKRPIILRSLLIIAQHQPSFEFDHSKSIFLSLSLSLSRSRCHHLPSTFSPTRSLSLFLVASLFRFLSIYLSVFVFVSFSLSLHPSSSPALSLFLSPYPSSSPSLSLSLSRCLSRSLALSFFIVFSFYTGQFSRQTE